MEVTAVNTPPLTTQVPTRLCFAVKVSLGNVEAFNTSTAVIVPAASTAAFRYTVPLVPVTTKAGDGTVSKLTGVPDTLIVGIKLFTKPGRTMIFATGPVSINPNSFQGWEGFNGVMRRFLEC
jgi:hypothetical protein